MRIEHAGRLAAHRPPVILAVNHLSSFEAIAVPATIMLVRGGHVSFVADWTALLYPGLAWYLHRSRVLLSWRKPARWRWVDAVARRRRHPSVLAQAAAVLDADGVVAIYPEGTRNPDPQRLLPPRSGVARLALATGAPVLPIGVDYVGRADGQPASGWLRLTVRVGAPMTFPVAAAPEPALVEATSAAIMHALAYLCRKRPAGSPGPIAPRSLAA